MDLVQLRLAGSIADLVEKPIFVDESRSIVSKAVQQARDGLTVLLCLPEGIAREDLVTSTGFNWLTLALVTIYRWLTEAVLKEGKPFLPTSVLLPILLSDQSYGKADVYLVTDEASALFCNKINSAREARGILPLKRLPITDEHSVIGQTNEDVSTLVEGASSLIGPRHSYHCVSVGGTFDQLHNGHKILLSAAALLADDNCVCAVSTDPLLINKKYKNELQPLARRMTSATEFIEQFRPGITVTAVPLSDIYGPTATDPTIDCLVVTSETAEGGSMCSKLRISKGLPPMDIVSVPVVEITTNEKLSSTYLRSLLAARSNDDA